MHRVFNLIASIILFLFALASFSIVAIGAMWATTNEGRDVMWQGVVVQVVGFTIFITFIIGGIRQFRSYLRKGREDELVEPDQQYEDEDGLYTQDPTV